MPELPHPKSRPRITPISEPDAIGDNTDRSGSTNIHYAELQVTTNFSFLRGASHPDEIVNRAAELGYAAVAITDLHTLSGVVRAHEAAKAANIRLLIGARIELRDRPDQPPGPAPRSLLLYPTDAAAYARLSRLLTAGKRRAPKGECHLTLDDVREHSAGLLAIAIPPEHIDEEFESWIATLKESFCGAGFQPASSDRLSLAAARLYGEGDEDHLEKLAAFSLRSGVPLVAVNDIHYAAPDRRMLQDILTCVRHGCTIQEAGFRLFPNGERYIKGPAEMARLFAQYPRAIARTVQIAGRITFSLDQLKYEYPEEVCPDGYSALDYLRELTWRGARERYSRPHDQRHILEPGGAGKAYATDRFAPDGATGCSHGWSEAAAAAERNPWEESLDSLSPRRGEGVSVSHDDASNIDQPDLSFAPPGRKDNAATLPRVPSASPTPPVATARCPYRGKDPLASFGTRAESATPADQDFIPAEIKTRLEHEFALIEELGYAKYFLTVYDIVRFARSQDILCQGRGAAANSAVCYCLGVTAVDPARIDLLFERFISRERNEPPDIDIDFEHERREEVIQYIYNRFGRERAAIVAEVITYRGRSAVRDIGKALGLSLDAVDQLARQLDWWDSGTVAEERIRELGLDPHDRTFRLLIHLCSQVMGFPRHLSQHVGGFVITQGRLDEIVPIENAAMPDRSFIEWDKDDIDTMGMLKVDCLGLGMLTAIRKSIDLVNLSANLDLQMHTIPPEDPEVYAMIQKADTVGVFQIESRAQMSMLPRLRPKEYYDLVIEVAIVRPGPIQGDMVHPYLRRRNGEEKIEYPGPEIERVLGRTLGVPLFQEQAMSMAIVAAGFTPGEADSLRRAMAAWKRKGHLLASYGTRIIEGMVDKGYKREYAERCFEQIKGFGEYGFPESHAASFALLAYISSWLKRRHPAAYAAGIINSQPMGFYQPAQIIADAQEHAVPVLPIDVNLSGWDCRVECMGGPALRAGSYPNPASRVPPITAVSNRCSADETHRPLFAPNGATECSHGWSEAAAAERNPWNDACDIFSPRRGDGKTETDSSDPSTLPRASSPSPRPPLPDRLYGQGGPAIRLGMRLVSGLGEEAGLAIEKAVAQHGPFRSIQSLWRASGVRVRVRDLRRLAAADAFNSLGLERRAALWAIRALRDEALPLFDQPGAHASGLDDAPPSLPILTLPAKVLRDYQTTGFSLKDHPMRPYRESLSARGVTPMKDLRDPALCPHGRRIKVAGLVLLRQRPGTASGIVFMTMEDETGTANLIVRPQVYERYRRIARHSNSLIITGTVERAGEVVHIMVRRIELLTDTAQGQELPVVQSRDFH